MTISFGPLRAALAKVRDQAENIALVAGAGLVSHGVGQIYAPAGEIAAGLFALAIAYLLSKAA